MRDQLGSTPIFHQKKQLTIDFDIDAFKQDVENGMYFQSSIPQGFGVGSSGALVAAVYGKYTKNKITIDSAPNNVYFFLV